MEEREKNKKILFIGLGIIVLVMLFFMIKACTGGSKKEKVNPNAITKISLKSESMTLSVGDSDKLSYTVIPSNTDETTKWVSSDDSIVSVDAMGNIKALKTGSAIVTLVAKNGVSAYTAIKVVSSTTVDGNNITASIVEKDISLKVGTTKKMLFEIDPKDTGYVEIMWESSNNVTATVDSDGLITGLRAGVTTITMKIILNDNTVLTDTATVTVEEEANLYLTSTINDIKNGEVIRASVAVSDPSVTIIDGTVKAANDKTASISNVLVENNYLNFDIKGGKKGNTTLKISANTSEGKSLSLDVTINVVEFTDLYISGGDKELLIEEAFILSARLEPSVSGELDTTCTSSNKNVNVDKTSPSGEYNGACQITAVKKGKSTVTISISGQKKSVSITVVEKATTNPDNPGEKPDEKPGENPGGTPTFGVLTSLEAILSKTEYNKNEVMGSLTVNAIDAAGVKLALNSTEYSFISEFDSTTFGSKELNIAYSKDGISKTVSVPYTVKSGSSTSGGGGAGEFPGSSPSGGGGGGGGGAAGVNTETGTLTINSENKANEDGSYNGSVKLDVAINNPGENTQYVLVTYGCDDFKDAAGNVNNIACDGNRETGLKYVHAEFVNIKDGKAIASLKSTTGDLYYSAILYKYDGKSPLTSDDLASAEDIGKLNLTPIATLTNGKTPLNITIKSDGTIQNENSNLEVGSIGITFTKEWYAKNEEAEAKVTIELNPGYKINSISINGESKHATSDIQYKTSVREKQINVVAECVKLETSETVVLSTSKLAKFD
ncbi:MAG: Ig-like domain-containing protein, partial [Bacilli bacterium]